MYPKLLYFDSLPLEPEMRMGRYHPPNISFIQFIQAMQLCAEAIGSMSRRTRVEPLYGGAT